MYAKAYAPIEKAKFSKTELVLKMGVRGVYAGIREGYTRGVREGYAAMGKACFSLPAGKNGNRGKRYTRRVYAVISGRFLLI